MLLKKGGRWIQERKRGYKNSSEQQAVDYLRERGWKCIKRGWPDFFVFKEIDDGLLFLLVEVKPRRSTKLSPYQDLVMNSLSKKGIRCFTFIEGTLYEYINNDIHIPTDPDKLDISTKIFPVRRKKNSSSYKIR